jgi:hypothetical protein
LVATIQQERKDLLLDIRPERPPIPTEIPPGYFNKDTPTVEGIGEPMTACFFTLSSIDPKKWLTITYFFFCYSGFANYSPCSGGCLKNMMALEDFGIRKSGCSILASVGHFRFQRK